jgi:hypothetical protein
MIQKLLLPDAVDADRWRPLLPAFRLRRPARARTTKPLPSQMFLPGMEPTEGDGEISLPPDGDSDDGCKPNEIASQPQPMCPNCGGNDFDEDGDCSSCWEPGVGGCRDIALADKDLHRAQAVVQTNRASSGSTFETIDWKVSERCNRFGYERDYLRDYGSLLFF